MCYLVLLVFRYGPSAVRGGGGHDPGSTTCMCVWQPLSQVCYHLPFHAPLPLHPNTRNVVPFPFSASSPLTRPLNLEIHKAALRHKHQHY